MNKPAAQIVVVTPVYEDVEASSQLFAILAKQYPAGLRVVAVDDGSVRQPLGPEGLQAAGVPGVILTLRRNVGHQRALAIGISYAAERLQDDQVLVVMDSDGEDQPESIGGLLDRLRSEHVDVLLAQRKSRVETFKFKAFYVLYKRLFYICTGRSISFGNFMAMSPAAARRLAAMQELPIHIASAVIASKLRTTVHPIDRGPRYAGQSKMNFTALSLHGFKALMVFAEDVLVRVGIACAALAVLSVSGITLAVVLKLLGISSPGWFSVALGILILLLLQTGALALMTLMLTGVVRGSSVATRHAYEDFIERELPVDGRDSDRKHD